MKYLLISLLSLNLYAQEIAFISDEFLEQDSSIDINENRAIETAKSRVKNKVKFQCNNYEQTSNWDINSKWSGADWRYHVSASANFRCL